MGISVNRRWVDEAIFGGRCGSKVDTRKERKTRGQMLD